MLKGFEPSQCRVALLAGGSSSEREISLASGKGAGGALREAGFIVEDLDPANPEDLVRLIREDFDVAFLALHGSLGEDGTIQGFLELIGLPYTGPGIWASASAINKAAAKRLYEQAGLPTPPAVTIDRDEAYDVAKIVNELGEHLVVKAACGGSTLGIYMVTREDELAGAIEQARDFDSEVVIERFVAGPEFTVVVFGGKEPRAFPVIQIVPANDFYDFDAKYSPGGSEHLCPAPISDELTARMQDLAVAAHKALGCYALSRTDFIVDAAEECWILETNTIPGMTPTSLLPDAARAAGMSFPEVCTELVKLALERG